MLGGALLLIPGSSNELHERTGEPAAVARIVERGSGKWCVGAHGCGLVTSRRAACRPPALTIWPQFRLQSFAPEELEAVEILAVAEVLDWGILRGLCDADAVGRLERRGVIQMVADGGKRGGAAESPRRGRSGNATGRGGAHAAAHYPTGTTTSEAIANTGGNGRGCLTCAPGSSWRSS